MREGRPEGGALWVGRRGVVSLDMYRGHSQGFVDSDQSPLVKRVERY